MSLHNTFQFHNMTSFDQIQALNSPNKFNVQHLDNGQSRLNLMPQAYRTSNKVHLDPASTHFDNDPYESTQKINVNNTACNFPTNHNPSSYPNPFLFMNVDPLLSPPPFSDLIIPNVINQSLFAKSLKEQILISALDLYVKQQQMKKYDLIKNSILFMLQKNSLDSKIPCLSEPSSQKLPNINKRLESTNKTKSNKTISKKEKPIIIIDDDEYEKSQEAVQIIEDISLKNEANLEVYCAPQHDTNDTLTVRFNEESQNTIKQTEELANKESSSTDICKSITTDDTATDLSCFEETDKYCVIEIEGTNVIHLRKVSSSTPFNQVQQKTSKNLISGYLEKQARIPPFCLNRKKNANKKHLKLIWNPDSDRNKNFDLYLVQIEEALGRTILNQEKVIRLLIKYDFNIDKIVQNIQRNKGLYRKHFK